MSYARNRKGWQDYGTNGNKMAYFATKGHILATKYLPIAPLTYYESIFGEDIAERRSYMRVNSKRKIRYTDNFVNMLQEESGNSDFYIRLCSFFNHYPRLDCMKRIYGLIVDIDHVSPADLQKLLKSDIFEYFPPTYITNSGNGIHLAYIFQKPIEAYNHTKEHIKTLYKALKGHFKGINLDVDMSTSIMQGFRVVGSRTKAGQIATAYIVGEKWDYNALCSRLLVVAEATPTPAPVPARPPRPDDEVVKYVPNGHKGFYDYTLRRIKEEVSIGHRYMSMLALVVIGYKCRRVVSYNQLVEDLYMLVESFNSKALCRRKQVKYNEIDKALKAYNNKATRVRSETLENWLDFKFERKIKRNKRKRKEHLELARQQASKAKQAKQDEKLGMMKRYLEQSPNATLTELVDVLGWSKPTVIKYRKMVK